MPQLMHSHGASMLDHHSLVKESTRPNFLLYSPELAIDSNGDFDGETIEELLIPPPKTVAEQRSKGKVLKSQKL